MRQRYDLPRVSGLLRPFPDSSSLFSTKLKYNDVNLETTRQQIINNCIFIIFIVFIYI